MDSLQVKSFLALFDNITKEHQVDIANKLLETQVFTDVIKHRKITDRIERIVHDMCTMTLLLRSLEFMNFIGDLSEKEWFDWFITYRGLLYDSKIIQVDNNIVLLQDHDKEYHLPNAIYFDPESLNSVDKLYRYSLFRGLVIWYK